jgi:hypothetical protein
MPYIAPRDRLFSDVTLGDYRAARDPGTLNYQITSLCVDYIKDTGEKYQHYNDVIGALECCKLEMYRRAIAPYEDKKIKENGDVY